MVKRKADNSLDEWLERGTIAPVTTHEEVAAATTGPARANCPTAEAEGAEEWFWALLESAGYERW